MSQKSKWKSRLRQIDADADRDFKLYRYKGRIVSHELGTIMVMKSMARMFLAGRSVAEVSRRTGKGVGHLMKLAATPPFRRYYRRLQVEYFRMVDVRIHRLLDSTVSALMVQLRNRDWRAVDAAIEKVLRIHGRYIEKIDVGVHHTSDVVEHHVKGAIALGVIPDAVMTPEIRKQARELLSATRRQLPQHVASITTAPKIVEVGDDEEG